MEKQINSDLIRGHIDTMILRILTEGDSYGYEIIKSVSYHSQGRYLLKEPSLYTSLRRLEKEQLIESYWGDESQGGRRKYYHITPKGKLQFEASVQEWLKAKEIIELLILV